MMKSAVNEPYKLLWNLDHDCPHEMFPDRERFVIEGSTGPTTSAQKPRCCVRFAGAVQLRRHPLKQIVAVVFGLGLICNALLFMPQALAVWRSKSSKDISLVTFAGFNVFQIIAVIHGVYQHDFSLILGMIASLLTSGTVTVLTIAYRRREA